MKQKYNPPNHHKSGIGRWHSSRLRITRSRRSKTRLTSKVIRDIHANLAYVRSNTNFSFQFSENGRFQTQNSPKMSRSFAFQPHIDPSRSTWGVLECASVSRRAREVGQSFQGGIVTSALNFSLLTVDGANRHPRPQRLQFRDAYIVERGRWQARLAIASWSAPSAERVL